MRATVAALTRAASPVASTKQPPRPMQPPQEESVSTRSVQSLSKVTCNAGAWALPKTIELLDARFPIGCFDPNLSYTALSQRSPVLASFSVLSGTGAILRDQSCIVRPLLGTEANALT